MLKDLFYKHSINAEVRDYQERIVEKTYNYLVSKESTIIQSPTGSGKTTMGLSVMKKLEEDYGGLKFGWCTMRKNNLKQVEKENDLKNFKLDIEFISMFDKNPPKVDVLMVDEGHHDATTSMNRIHSVCKPEFLFSATATPIRGDRAALFFKNVVKDATIRFLIKSGYLSKYNHNSLPDWMPSTVAEAYCRDKKRWGKSVMFFRTQKECKEALMYMNEDKVRAEIVTGESDRDRQIEDFRKGKLDLLINMMVLTEGFDCPELDSVFVRPSSKGPTMQMSGRVLRTYKNKIKNIIQSSDTKYEFIKEAPANDRFMLNENGIWVDLEENDNLEKEVYNSMEQLSKLIMSQLGEKL